MPSQNMDDLQGNIYNQAHTVNAASVGCQEKDVQWFVMRDLKRANVKYPAYQMLEDMGVKVFTPMVWKLLLRHGKRIPQKMPFMQDLLFVHESYEVLTPIVERTDTLQYRFLRDGKRTPMTVRDAEMERFITAVEATDNPCFYAPKT